jgi:hypothetical protein
MRFIIVDRSSLVQDDPLGMPRNPFHVFLIIITFLNGLALVFGLSTSLTLQRELISLLERGYGLLLAAGAFGVLVGMFWPGDPRDGLLAKRAGYVALATASMIYAYGTVARFGVQGVLLGSLCVAFGSICIWYVRIINKIVRAAIGDSEEETP